MTRTRRSVSQKRRSALRSKAIVPSQRKVVKRKPATQASKDKGIVFVCSICKIYKGPRKSVEGHCSAKHRLTGKRLQDAIKLVSGGKATPKPETSVSSGKNIASLQRSSKRVRKAPDEVDDVKVEAKRGKRTPGKLKQDLEETKGTTDLLKNMPKSAGKIGASPGMAKGTSRNKKEMQSKNKITSRMIGDASSKQKDTSSEPEGKARGTKDTSNETEYATQETEDIPDVTVLSAKQEKPKETGVTPKKGFDTPDQGSDQQQDTKNTLQKLKGKSDFSKETSTTSVDTQKTAEMPIGTCERCKRKFSRARQLEKHKCFAALDDEPVQKPKPKFVSPDRGKSASKKTISPNSVSINKQSKKVIPTLEKISSPKKVVLAKPENVVPAKPDLSKATKHLPASKKSDGIVKQSQVVSALSPERESLEIVKNKESHEEGEVEADSVMTMPQVIATCIESDITDASKGESSKVPEVTIEKDQKKKTGVAAALADLGVNSKDENDDDDDADDATPFEVELGTEDGKFGEKKRGGPWPKRFSRGSTKNEELTDFEKEKIAESVALRKYVPGTPLAGATERVQISIQNGNSFCLCSFCEQITQTSDHMKEHLCQHIRNYLPFQCTSCVFLSRKRGRITAHMKKSHGGFLQCKNCSYTTYDKVKLDRHYSYWNRDFNNSCQFCHKKVPEGTKEEHMKTVHGKTGEDLANINLSADAFTCRYCGARMKSRHARRDHEKRHNPHFTCPLCSYSTNSESAFVNHGRKHRVVLVCSECLCKHHSSQALKDHLQVHIDDRANNPLLPKENTMQLLYEKSVNQSIFVASALDEATIPECDIIGLDMNMRVREEERRVSEKNMGEAGRGRPIASAVTVEEMQQLNFGTEYDVFIKNIEYRHLSMKTLSFMFARYGKRECSHCGFLLHSLGSWKIHTGSHEGKTDLACPECDYKCRHKFLLERHILITHKKQDFGCDLCDKRFPYREYVYLHKRKEHYGGNMTCTFCEDPIFQTEDEKLMKRHIIEEHPEMTSTQIEKIIGRKVHFTGRDGILFVKCKYCQKGFNRAAFLRQHVQLVHLKKKTFLCDQCGYKSNTSARLRTHMAVHTEKRDVTCDQCGAGFKNKVYLYKHIRRSHKRYATARGAAYCKRTRLKNMISLLQKERQEGSSYERQEIIQKEKAKLFGLDKNVTVEGVREERINPTAVDASQDNESQVPTQINVFQCGDCGEYFDSISTLKNHFTNVHGESPNIPLDFDTGGGSGSSDAQQVNIALDALNNGNMNNSVNQLFQCAKCNRMFPDMKSVEHHVKVVHATDTFLISDESDIPSQELDLAAEVITQLTRETSQANEIDVMRNTLSQSGAAELNNTVTYSTSLDTLSLEAQDAASTLTSLPDAVLENSQMHAQAQAHQTVTYQIQSSEAGHLNGASSSQSMPTSITILPQEISAVVDQQNVGSVSKQESGDITSNIEVVVSGRDDELEAAQLLQQMGIFQHFTTTTTTTSDPVPASSDVTTTNISSVATTSEETTQGDSEEESVTIMVIEGNTQNG
ncbi:Zinc finger protein ZFAT [Holothuria leucospilota]|uniref:Zinc finger protein ZFAT n=1 Tax=Holothuria leucospilota TaxID=206669 RepID=A0A9Q1BJM9_HOLLE|nr:Zinc finger protein ZFAT [Holothuria leucospilota]